MTIEIKVPSPGESITEVVLGPWQKSTGQWVEKDDSLPSPQTPIARAVRLLQQ